MTEEQWIAINARISSIQALGFAIAKASPNIGAIKKQLAVELEVMETVFLNSQQSDAQFAAIKRCVEQIQEALDS